MAIQHSSKRKGTRKGAVVPRLKREIRRLLQCRKVAIIPIIIGDLGTVGRGFQGLIDIDNLRVCTGTKSIMGEIFGNFVGVSVDAAKVS